MEWSPHPRLDPSLIGPLREAIASFPAEHLLPPSDGEEVNSVEEGYIRLQNYAFANGYLLTRSGNPKEKLRLSCKHHGTETRNWRDLTDEERNKVDESGKAIHRAATQLSQKESPYLLNVVYKRVKGS